MIQRPCGCYFEGAFSKLCLKHTAMHNKLKNPAKRKALLKKLKDPSR